MIKVIFLTLISWTSPGAPIDSLRLETINGKQFVIHKIDEKETLYSISRRYDVPITAILEVNPAADGGLATGQILKVPYVPKGIRQSLSKAVIAYTRLLPKKHCIQSPDCMMYRLMKSRHGII